MYIAICDDQDEELDKLITMLQLWENDRGVSLRYKTFCNTGELLEAALKEPFNLYLLDIMMPGINGIDAAREIRNFDSASPIVFFTSTVEFAYESYSVKAMEYILKPVQEDKLFPILDTLHQREQKPEESLVLKSGTTLIRVPYSQLVYVEVLNKHLYFNLADGQTYEIVGSLKDYEHLLLARPEFMYIHRSYIVNMFQAEKFSQSELYTFSGHVLPVSRRIYPKLQKDYVNLLFSK